MIRADSETAIVSMDSGSDQLLSPSVLKWVNLTLVTAGTYPLHMARRLVQVGYEPMPPTHCTSLFGRSYLVYPNMLQYISHIKRTDGYFGLYRGLVPRVLEFFTYKAVYEALCQLDKKEDQQVELDGPVIIDSSVEESEDESWASFFKEIKNCVSSHLLALIVSHPFRVIAVRSIAEFAGHEGLYGSLVASFKEIATNEGLSGFFAGIIPTVLGGLFGLVASSFMARCIMQYAIKKPYKRNHFVRGAVSIASDFTVGYVFYPFNVTSAVMMLSGSRLRLAQQPEFMTSSWLECLKQLRERRLAYRGFSIFYRQVVA